MDIKSSPKESQLIDEDLKEDNSIGGVSDEGALGLPLPVNHSPVPKFGNLHFFFQKLANTTGSGSTERRKSIVSGFINSWRRQVGDDLYPFVRLWFSEEDDQLKQLRKIKDTMLARLLVDALSLPVTSPDALAILDVRKGAYTGRFSLGPYGKDDGFPLKAKEAIEKRYAQSEFSNWTIDAVGQKLVEFADARKQERVEILKEFLDTMNSHEMYWLLKIIMGNVSLNCSVRSFLHLLHPDAEKVYLVNKSLQMVCRQLWSHEFQVSESDKYVHLQSHFFPMRAKYVKGVAEHMEAVTDLMSPTTKSAEKGSQRDAKNGNASNGRLSFYIEEKIDGVRVQLHWTRHNDEILIFSRNGKDHTLSYQSIFWDEPVTDFYRTDKVPRVNDKDNNNDNDSAQQASTEKAGDEEEANMKRRKFSMQDLVDDDVDSCIIDGEIVAWDPATNDICGQSKVRELASHERGGAYRHLLLVFDVVLINERVLTEESLRDRKAQLEQLFPESKRHLGKGRIQVLPYKVGHDAADISREFDRVISQMSEGLVVKNPDSSYQIDGRNNNWIKVKPEFVDGYQGENLDIVVAGCYWGKGKNANRFASYLCVMKDETDNNRYVALARVGSGICLAMYDYINDLIEPHRFTQARAPNWLVLGSERAPDFYIDPKVSIVLEVKYSSILSVVAESAKHRSAGYGVGYSLRFPRYVRLREDKDYKSSLTIEELLEAQHYIPSSAGPRKHSDSEGHGVSRSPKRTKRIRHDVADAPVEFKSRIFAGTVFYVCGDISDPVFMTRAQVQTLIQENGGLVTSLITNNAIPIADKKSTNALKLIVSNRAVLRPQYLLDCIENNRQLAFEPTHFLSGAPVSSNGAPTVDRFGFALHRKQSPKDVANLFGAIDVNGLNYSKHDLERAEERLMNMGSASPSPASTMRAFLFSGWSCFIHGSLKTSQRALVWTKLKYGNAVIVDNISEATHVVANSLDDVPQYSERQVTLVSSAWVHECWRERKLLSSQKMRN